MEALRESPGYRETVSAILGAGFIQGEQSLESMDAHLLDWR